MTIISVMREEEIRNNFAKNLLSLRKAKNLSQAQLATALNYTYKAVSKWENMETIPDIVTLNAIADYFDITVDDLISNKDVVKKSNKKVTRRRITLSSVGVCFVVIGLIYLSLSLANVNKSYIVIPFAALTSGIVYLVFSCLWFNRLNVMLAISIIDWSVALIVMLFMDFAYFWVILIIALFINLAFYPFIKIIINRDKNHEPK